MSTGEHFETGSKKVRGMAQRSLDLIEAMRDIAEGAQPITGRGVGYKLFTKGFIPSMARSEMQRVYRLLKEAREQGIIPWDWIVDETRATGGVGEGVLATLLEHGFDGTIERVASKDSFIPLGDAALEVLLSENTIEATAIKLAH